MKERPIPFTAPMVRAILAGAKTQTRRPIKPQPSHPAFRGMLASDDEGIELFLHDSTLHRAIRCPYGQPGDRLWVREAWGYRCSSGTKAQGQYMHFIEYRADNVRREYGPMPMDGVGLPKWKERIEGQSPKSWDETMTRYWQQWRPGMFMPRWASRIALEVAVVRVERLQDISRGDAMAEGCPFPNMAQGDDPRQWYRELWEQINGVGSWDANPWVWVLDFRLAAK
jgi:hypothetical protein